MGNPQPQPQAFTAYHNEKPLMDRPISQLNNDPQVDEKLWDAWVQKNKAKDQARFARRKKIVGVVLVLGMLLVLFWRFTR